MAYCPMCKRTDAILTGRTTSTVTGDDRFCGTTCLEADPRWQAATIEARQSYGLFTCHNADGVPHTGAHLPYCALYQGD